MASAPLACALGGGGPKMAAGELPAGGCRARADNRGSHLRVHGHLVGHGNKEGGSGRAIKAIFLYFDKALCWFYLTGLLRESHSICS